MRDLLHLGHPTCFVGHPAAPALRPALPSTITLPAPSPAPPRRIVPLLPAATSTLWPAPLDPVGTAAATHGDLSLGHQLATEAATEGEVLDPSVEALQPRLLLRLRRPDVNGGGGCIEIRCMLQAYLSNVLVVLEVHFKCFRMMLQK
jgi:hypothetical protein